MVSNSLFERISTKYSKIKASKEIGFRSKAQAASVQDHHWVTRAAGLPATPLEAPMRIDVRSFGGPKRQVPGVALWKKKDSKGFWAEQALFD